MDHSIKQTVRDYILREFLPGEDPAELTDQTPLITGGVLDSIRTLKLVVFLEETFDTAIEAHEADVDHLDTLDAIDHLISRKQARVA